MNMSAAKKRKIDDKGRVFNSEWCTKFIVVPRLLNYNCWKNIILNVIKQLSTPPNLRKFLAKRKWTKLNIFKKIHLKTRCFTTYKKDSELVTQLRFKLCECMAEKGKPFSDGEFIKNYLIMAMKGCSAFPKAPALLESHHQIV